MISCRDDIGYDDNYDEISYGDKLSLKNHAGYISINGYYGIIYYLCDHIFAISKVVTRQLARCVTSEVDFESLFSQAVYLSHPERNCTKTRTFERLVIMKLKIQRFYYCLNKVLKEYI